MDSMQVEHASVAVVVVARNEARNITRCIGSLKGQDYSAFSVILVDDGSTDETVRIARTILPTIHVISSPTRSISQNRDIGWRAANTDFVAFLDADCEAPANWLTELVEAARESEAAAVGGGNRPPYDETPHFAALGLMLQTFIGSRGSVQGQVPNAKRYVAHLPGLNVMYRTDALRLVGGFDPRFARMGEDEDLSRRLGDIGLRLYVTPYATVIHRQRTDLRSWARNMRSYGRGRTWLLRRHPNAVSPLFALPPLTIPGLPIYLPLIAIYAAWVTLRAGRLGLWPRLFLLFAGTHLAYGLGQVEGLFLRGDNVAARQKRDRVALLALKNAGNKGDEAISTCVTARLTDEIERVAAPIDLYLGAIGPSGFDIRPVPRNAEARDMMIREMLASSTGSRDVNEATILAIPRLVTVLAHFRAIVIAGGQWLHDLHLTKHMAVCGIFAFARICRTNTGVFCVGSGPLRMAFSRVLLRLAFSRNSLLITRDEESAKLIRSCGLANAQTATDPAIELGTDALEAHRGAILLSPCAWSSFENIYERADEQIEQDLAYWRKLVSGLLELGKSVVLLPTMNPEDTAFAVRIASGFNCVEVVETELLTPAEIQGLIAAADALISMRLHPVIFASNVQTHFVALTYASKVRAFCEQAGLESHLVPLNGSDWTEMVFAKLAQPVNQQSADAARAHQQQLLVGAYSQFFNWLRVTKAATLSNNIQAG